MQIAGGMAGDSEAFARHEFIPDPIPDAGRRVGLERGAVPRVVPVDRPDQLPRPFAFQIFPESGFPNHAAHQSPDDREMADQDLVSDVAVLAKILCVFHGGEEGKCLLCRQDLFDWLVTRFAELACESIRGGRSGGLVNEGRIHRRERSCARRNTRPPPIQTLPIAD